MGGHWYEETFGGRFRVGFKTRRTLYANRSAFQQVDVIETEMFGKALVLDGLFMTSEKDEFFYHEMISHPAIAAVERPARVLVIGGGDGGTVREVLRHAPVEQVVMVEIDQEVIDVSQRFLPAIGTAFDNPRLELRIGDGVAYAAEAPDESFDVVLLDGSDPVGPAEGLFGERFYRDVARILRPGGIFGLQSESPILMPDLFCQIQRALAGIFSDVRPYLGPVPLYGASSWSWTLARREGDVLPLDLSIIEALEPSLRYLNRDICRGAFALPNYIRDLLRSSGTSD